MSKKRWPDAAVVLPDLVLNLVDPVPAQPPVMTRAEGQGEILRLLGQPSRPGYRHPLLPVDHLRTRTQIKLGKLSFFCITILQCFGSA